MSPPRIYADFNGLVAGVRNPARTAVVLDTFGTVRELANAGIVLYDGLELIAYDWSDDHEDLEGHGAAYFDPARKRWVAEFDEQGVRHVAQKDRTPVTSFHCVSCRLDLSDRIDVRRGADGKICPDCGTPVDAPIAPPNPQD